MKIMVLSTRIPTQPSVHEYSPVLPELGIRDLIVLTLGAVDNSISKSELFTLTKNLLNTVQNSKKSIYLSQNVFQNMLKKLRKESIIEYFLDSDKKAYRIKLSARGTGELDATLFSKNHIISKWKCFKEFALLAAS